MRGHLFPLNFLIAALLCRRSLPLKRRTASSFVILISPWYRKIPSSFFVVAEYKKCYDYKEDLVVQWWRELSVTNNNWDTASSPSKVAWSKSRPITVNHHSHRIEPRWQKFLLSAADQCYFEVYRVTAKNRYNEVSVFNINNCKCMIKHQRQRSSTATVNIRSSNFH